MVFQPTKNILVFCPQHTCFPSPLLPFLFEKCLLGTRTNERHFPNIQPTIRRRGDFSTTMAFSVVSCFPRGTKCFDFFSPPQKKKKVFCLFGFVFHAGVVLFRWSIRDPVYFAFLSVRLGGDKEGDISCQSWVQDFPQKLSLRKKRRPLFRPIFFSTWFCKAM